MKNIYEAVRARIKKDYLLSKEIIEGLLEQKTISDVIEILKATDYKKEISELKHPFNLIEIEHSLKRNLIKHFYELIIASNYSPLFLAYFYEFIIHNLKVILKGKILKKKYSELYNSIILDAEAYLGRRDMIIKVLEAETVDDAILQLSKYIFGKETQIAYTTYKETKNINVFDILLDKNFIEEIISSWQKLNYEERRSCEDIVALDVDSYHILSILRSKYLGLDSSFQKELIAKKTFFIDSTLLSSIITTENIEDCFIILKNSHYGFLIKEEIKFKEDLPILEFELKKYSYKLALNKFFKGEFTLDLGLSFIKLKKIEIQNIISIIFGIINGIKPTEIYKKLIL